MNTQLIAAKRAQLDAEAADIDALLEKAIDTGTTAGLDTKELGKRIQRVKEEKEDLDREEEIHKATEADPRWAALRMYGGDLGTEPTAPTGAALTGKQVSPLEFGGAELKAMYKAFQNRAPMSIRAKSFSSVVGELPAQLDPAVVGKIHESRILERIPTIAINAPSYEFIVHNFASDSGAPGMVAEGGTKPEYVPAVTSSVVTAQKIAMHTGISYESLADWPQWLSYVQGECFRQIMDKENSQLLTGDGTGVNLLGFLQTSGILTHNCSSDPGTWTGLDSIEQSIVQLRTGTALAEPDLLILSPTTWGVLRRIKSTTGQYIVNPDPTKGAGNSIWGVDVLVTTAQADGTGLLLDTQKFGRALVREGITMHQGYANDDFVKNIARYVFETRLALAVERPQAVLAISNLPTS